MDKLNLKKITKILADLDIKEDFSNNIKNNFMIHIEKNKLTYTSFNKAPIYTATGRYIK